MINALPNRPVRAVAWAVVALVFLSLPARAQSVSNSFWQAQSIYQIITDRFFDGDPSNNNADGNYNPSGQGSVHGGDFKGIEQKLDYIKALGATAIWISPVVVNANGEFYGYSGRDFYNVDPHWGNLAALQHMIQAAHARGLLVIDDIVVNHGGDLIYSTNSGYGNFVAPPGGYLLKYRGSKMFAAPFDPFNFLYDANNNALTNLFHNNGTIQNFNDTNQVVLGELSGLDDFRTESSYVRTQMVNIYNYWIGQAGFDGFRIDTTKHVDMGFWQTWCPAVHSFAATNGRPNFFMFGEVFDGSESKCGSYTGTMGGGAFKQDSVLDYPLYFNINNVFASATGATKPIEDHYNAIAANYDTNAQMRLVTFLDNHDQPRFLSIGDATTNRLKVAMTFLYTSRGIPCLYYGTEQGFNGATDPFDREDMFAGQFKDGPSGVDSFNMTHPLFLLAAQLNNFRRLYPALQIGSHVNKWNDPGSPGLFAYARRLPIGGTTQEVFVVFNTSTSTQTLTNRSTAFTAGTPIVNLFNTNEVLTIQSGPQTPLITVPATSAKIFVAQSDWKPLDPVVVSNFPAHDAASVPSSSHIVLQFSGAMDTNSVQGAFGTTPAVSGTFAWSPAHDTMTFTAAGALPPLTNIIVRVTNSAVDAVSGNTMFAPYQMQFHTAAGADMTPPTVALLAPTNSAIVSGNLLISGTAADNVAVQKVEVRFDGGAWLTATGTTSWTFSLNSSNFLNGPHTLNARSTDTSGNTSSISSANVRFINVPGNYVQRISGGNPSDVIDCTNGTWVTDKAYTPGDFGFSGGANGFLNNTITGICAQAQSLYQRERYSTDSGGFFYQFDCPEGVYEVTLLEAETFWNSPGQRLFNVFIQGQQVLTNFDIFTAAGGMNLPVSLVFTTQVINSQLQVLFQPVVDNARVSGLQARKIADVYSDSDGIPDWWRLAYFGHVLGSATDNSRGPDDADGDGVSNLTEFLNGTDPLNTASFPTLAPFDIAQIVSLGSNIQVFCPTVTNWSYQLLGLDSLDAAMSWMNIGPLLSGTGSNVLFNDIITNDEKFYRVQAR
jgi:alpha-amylase